MGVTLWRKKPFAKIKWARCPKIAADVDGSADDDLHALQALYNIVDSIFVSRICEDALTAVSMAFPLQNIIISIAVGFGVGINALLSRALGQKNAERVNQVAVNGCCWRC